MGGRFLPRPDSDSLREHIQCDRLASRLDLAITAQAKHVLQSVAPSLREWLNLVLPRSRRASMKQDSRRREPICALGRIRQGCNAVCGIFERRERRACLLQRFSCRGCERCARSSRWLRSATGFAAENSSSCWSRLAAVDGGLFRKAERKRDSPMPKRRRSKLLKKPEFTAGSKRPPSRGTYAAGGIPAI